jgi:hypothetical protein
MTVEVSGAYSYHRALKVSYQHDAAYRATTRDEHWTDENCGHLLQAEELTKNQNTSWEANSSLASKFFRLSSKL